jgi:hypothetical protein
MFFFVLQRHRLANRNVRFCKLEILEFLMRTRFLQLLCFANNINFNVLLLQRCADDMTINHYLFWWSSTVSTLLLCYSTLQCALLTLDLVYLHFVVKETSVGVFLTPMNFSCCLSTSTSSFVRAIRSNRSCSLSLRRTALAFEPRCPYAVETLTCLVNSCFCGFLSAWHFDFRSCLLSFDDLKPKVCNALLKSPIVKSIPQRSHSVCKEAKSKHLPSTTYLLLSALSLEVPWAPILLVFSPQAFSSLSLFGYGVYLYAMETMSKKTEWKGTIDLAIAAPVTISSSESFCVAISVMESIVPRRDSTFVTACFVPGYVILPYESFTYNQLVPVLWHIHPLISQSRV